MRLYGYAADHALLPYVFIDYASVDAPLESGKSYYPFTDSAGLPIRIEDASGDAVWTAHHTDPYGAITVKPLPYYLQCNAIEYRLRWPGHYFDPELGLHLNRYRDYDPQLGRYIEPDPLGHAGGINLYAYCRDPIGDVDLLGLKPCPKANGAEPAAQGRTPAEADPSGTFRDTRGRLHDSATGHFVNDSDASSSRRPDFHAAYVMNGNRKARREGMEGAALDPTDSSGPLSARDTALAERDRLAALGETDAANQAQGRSNRATEELGVLAAKRAVETEFPGATLIYEGRGPNTFDLVYANSRPPPYFILAEGKGGTATNSSSRLINGRRHQQGTPGYQESVRAHMQQHGDADAQQVATRLGGDGVVILSVEVHQPITTRPDPRRPGRTISELGEIYGYTYGPRPRESENDE